MNSGVAALIIPASEESIHCWAVEKSKNGAASQISPRSAMYGQSERFTGWRAAGKRLSVAAPKAMRPKATSAGARCSRPMSISRKDGPQVKTTPASISQSRVEKPT